MRTDGLYIWWEASLPREYRTKSGKCRDSEPVQWPVDTSVVMSYHVTLCFVQVVVARFVWGRMA